MTQSIEASLPQFILRSHQLKVLKRYTIFAFAISLISKVNEAPRTGENTQQLEMLTNLITANKQSWDDLANDDDSVM